MQFDYVNVPRGGLLRIPKDAYLVPKISAKTKSLLYIIYKYTHLIYHIYKYTYYILFNNKQTTDKSIINLHSIANFQKFLKNKKGGAMN